MKEIGIIGVGLMGHGIAKNVVKNGWKLNFLKHPGNQPTTDIEAEGAVGWLNAYDMAVKCDAIILCVTGSAQVEDVLVGSGRVLDALQPNKIIIDCSTAIPSSTIKLAKRVEEKGARFVDAPMTRTPKEAEQGRLNLLVGGDIELVSSLRKLFSSFAENVFHAGGTGAGHQLKLLHNFVSLGTVSLIAEAIACGAKGGVSMDALVECLQKGGGSGVALDRLSPFIASGATEQLQFTLANACKDLDYYNAMAKDLDARNAIAGSVHKTFELLVERGKGGSFVPEQITLLQQYGANISLI
jgi:3-hydroxyisobutyrate dehydrogenase-like beta-hydroxyacid dehydrogenase